MSNLSSLAQGHVDEAVVDDGPEGVQARDPGHENPGAQKIRNFQIKNFRLSLVLDVSLEPKSAKSQLINRIDKKFHSE